MELTPNTDIHDANFTVRTLNVIKQTNGRNDWWKKERTITTLKDLSGYSEEEIFSLKGAGKRVFMEIKSVIHQVGLTFSEKSNRGNWNGYDFKKFKTFKNIIKEK